MMGIRPVMLSARIILRYFYGSSYIRLDVMLRIKLASMQGVKMHISANMTEDLAIFVFLFLMMTSSWLSLYILMDMYFISKMK